MLIHHRYVYGGYFFREGIVAHIFEVVTLVEIWAFLKAYPDYSLSFGCPPLFPFHLDAFYNSYLC